VIVNTKYLTIPIPGPKSGVVQLSVKGYGLVCIHHRWHMKKRKTRTSREFPPRKKSALGSNKPSSPGDLIAQFGDIASNAESWGEDLFGEISLVAAALEYVGELTPERKFQLAQVYRGLERRFAQEASRFEPPLSDLVILD